MQIENHSSARIRHNDLEGRLPKQFGDFAESLVMYLLGRHKGATVALVDHVGADIMAAASDGARYAISVKGRNFPENETKMFHFSQHDIDMLQSFSDSFSLIPAVAFVFVDNLSGEYKIRVFICRLTLLDKLADDNSCGYVLKSTRGGIIFKYWMARQENYLEEIRATDGFDYTELSFDVLTGSLDI